MGAQKTAFMMWENFDMGVSTALSLVTNTQRYLLVHTLHCMKVIASLFASLDGWVGG